MNMLKTTAAAAVALVVSMGAASALSLEAGKTATDVAILTNDNNPVYIDVDVTETLRVIGVSFSSTGGSVSDLDQVTFGIVSPFAEFEYTEIDAGPPPNTSRSFVVNDILTAGTSFQIFLEANTPPALEGPVGFTVSITTAAVPVPAALPMMAGGIALLGFAGRKMKKKA